MWGINMKKKALVVTAVAGFVRGFLSHDMKLLQDRGYEVHCATNAETVGAENIDEYFREINVIFHQVNFSSASPVSIQTIKSYKQMKQLLKGYDFQVVHCHTPIAAAITRAACFKYRKKGLKVIYTSHGFYFHRGSSKKTWLFFYTLEKLQSLWTDAIITINFEDYNNAQKMFCKNVFHINGVGIDTRRYTDLKIDRTAYRNGIGIKNDQIMILSIGELSRRKNHQIVIKAISKLNNPKLVFVICGRAMQGVGTFEELTSLSKELKVKTVFIGFRDDIPQVCHCADIGTIPSTREGLGLAGIELLASGVPLVGSNVHGINDYVINGVTGFTYNPYDDNGFTEGIRKLCNEQTRLKMKNNCISKALEFDQSISFKQMRDIYKKIL